MSFMWVCEFVGQILRCPPTQSAVPSFTLQRCMNLRWTLMCYSTKISHCFVEWEFKNEVVIILFALRGFVRSTDACCEVICSVYKGPANVYINIPLAFKSLRRTYIMGICNLNWCPLNVLALISAFWASKVLHKPWQDISVDGWHWKSPGGEW